MAAVESGRAAISAMDGIKTALPSVSPIEPKLDIRQQANRHEEPAQKVHRHERPVRQMRVPVAKQKRTSIAVPRK